MHIVKGKENIPRGLRRMYLLIKPDSRNLPYMAQNDRIHTVYLQNYFFILHILTYDKIFLPI